MANLVIVAIPREDDPIWQISSEKVPHLTILFLGDSSSAVNEIAGFVEHASSVMLSRFGLDVDRRGELGEDKADVLFFQDNWELPRLRQFRAQLLKDNNIRTAYDSASQFGAPQDWTPHLTLGYPETPAKPTKERIYWVQFDRIAVWTGDYEGPEFVLKREEFGMDVAAWGDTGAKGRQFLVHYGVKGMRWGVRKDRSAAPAVVNTTLKRSGKVKLKASGGKRQPVAAEAINAALAVQTLKKSGAAALSNDQLRDLNTRLQLEQQATELTAKRRPAAEKFVKDTVVQTGKRQVGEVINIAATRERKKRFGI